MKTGKPLRPKVIKLLVDIHLGELTVAIADATPRPWEVYDPRVHEWRRCFMLRGVIRGGLAELGPPSSGYVRQIYLTPLGVERSRAGVAKALISKEMLLEAGGE